MTRPLADQEPGVPGHLLAAATDAYASNRPLVLAWLRQRSGEPLEVFVSTAGQGTVVGEDIHEVPLLYPPGARGVPVSPEVLWGLLEPFTSWIPCLGMADHLVMEQQGDLPAVTGNFEDCVSYLHDSSFAWVVVGIPRSRETLAGDLRRLRLEVGALRDESGNSEQARLDCERAEARYRELSAARASGTWDVRVLAAAADGGTANRVASLLCSATDLIGLPYALVPDIAVTDLAAAMERTFTSEDCGSSPFLVTTPGMVALARPPDTEIPGLRVATSPDFDVSPEGAQPATVMPEGLPAFDGGQVVIGSVLDRQLRASGPLEFSLPSLNRHTFVCGATGSGKSQTVRTLLEGLSVAGIPWLVIEPAKAEYAAGMSGRLGSGQVLLLRPGDPNMIAAGLNPLEPAPGFPLQSHVDLVRALFLAAFQADEPFPQIVSQALTRCYQECGWDLVTGEPRVSWAVDGRLPPYPSLTQLQAAAQAVVTDIGYSDKVASDIRGYVDVRIGSLRGGSPGRLFEGGHPIDIGELLHRNVVLEIENISNDEDKAFVIGTFLVRLVEHLRVRNKASGTRSTEEPLRHVTVVEEAHRLLRNVVDSRTSSHAIELFAALLAEVRAYGEGIIIAEQIPSKLLPDVIKNTACKIVHRLPAADDRASVGATMNLTLEQSEYVVSLRPGVAAVFADGMDRPVLAVMPNRAGREIDGQPDLRPPLVRQAIPHCRVDCLASACTLRETSASESILRLQPRLELWLDLIVYNHIAGWPSMPKPLARWHSDLVRAVDDQRRLACAVARAAGRAVDARRRWLVEMYDPDELVGHVVDVAARVLAGEASGCTAAMCARYQAGRERWMDVIRALERVADKSVPHKDTERWLARGLDLRGMPASQQYKAVADHSSLSFPFQVQLEMGGRPSRIAGLLDRVTLPGAPGPVVTSGLAFFEEPLGWTVRRMIPQLTAEWAPSAARAVAP